MGARSSSRLVSPLLAANVGRVGRGLGGGPCCRQEELGVLYQVPRFQRVISCSYAAKYLECLIFGPLPQRLIELLVPAVLLLEVVDPAAQRQAHRLARFGDIGAVFAPIQTLRTCWALTTTLFYWSTTLAGMPMQSVGETSTDERG